MYLLLCKISVKKTRLKTFGLAETKMFVVSNVHMPSSAIDGYVYDHAEYHCRFHKRDKQIIVDIY